MHPFSNIPKAWKLANGTTLAIALGMTTTPAAANELLKLYDLAKANNTTLQAAVAQRDATVEVRPQALAQWLPGLTANTNASRVSEKLPATNLQELQSEVCTPTDNQRMANCVGDTRAYGLTLSQTLWSFQSFSHLREANLLAALREDIPLTAPQPPSLEEWITAARADNPNVRAAQLQLEAAERDIAAQRGRGLPSLMLTGSSVKTFQDQQLGGNQVISSIGLSVVWPLFQGGAVASAIRHSRALQRQAEANYETAQRDTERQTRSAYRDAISGIQRIAAAKRARVVSMRRIWRPLTPC